jgi:hypothetical protein
LHVTGNHERQVLRLPLERQSASDAFTSGQLSQAEKRWLTSHADSCDADLHQGQRWSDQLGTDAALCHGSPRSDVEYLLETPLWQARCTQRQARISPATTCSAYRLAIMAV